MGTGAVGMLADAAGTGVVADECSGMLADAAGRAGGAAGAAAAGAGVLTDAA